MTDLQRLTLRRIKDILESEKQKVAIGQPCSLHLIGEVLDLVYALIRDGEGLK